MNTRKVKDAKDISTNELIYFKGHAKATYMSDGTAVEDAIPTKTSQLTNDSGYITSDDLNFSGSAEDVTFDPAGTGLASTNVQDAIAEVKEVVDNAVIEGGGVVIVQEVGTSTDKVMSQKAVSEKIGHYKYSYNFAPSTSSQGAITINLTGIDDFFIKFTDVTSEKWRIAITYADGTTKYINPRILVSTGAKPSNIDTNNIGIVSLYFYMQASDTGGSLAFELMTNMKLAVENIQDKVSSKLGKNNLNWKTGDLLGVGVDFNITPIPDMVELDFGSVNGKSVNLYNKDAEHLILENVDYKSSTKVFIQDASSVSKGFVVVLGKPFLGALNRLHLIGEIGTSILEQMVVFTISDISNGLDGISPIETGGSDRDSKRTYTYSNNEANYICLFVSFKDTKYYNTSIIDHIVYTIGGQWETEYIPYDAEKIKYKPIIDISSELDAKLDKNLGAINAGKVLQVGADGTIEPTEQQSSDTQDVTDCVRKKDYTQYNLGENILNGVIGTGYGWTHSDGNYTHTEGTEPLVFNVNTEAGESYIAQIYTSSSDFYEEEIMVYIGNGEPCDIYRGMTGPHYIGMISDGGQLKIAISSTRGLSIHSIELRKIVAPSVAVKTIKYEHLNVNIDEGKDITGFWNVGVASRNCLQNLQNGSRNIAIGNFSLTNLSAGERNIAIGTFALNQLKRGTRNIAIGADAMYRTGYSNMNVAIGKGAAGYTHATPFEHTYEGNTAVGHNALGGKAKDYYNNTAVGYGAMSGFIDDTVTRERNVAVGYESCHYGKADNVSIGYRADRYTKGSNNVAIGNNTGDSSETGNNNVLIGSNAKIKSGEGTWQAPVEHNNTIVIGANAIAKKSNQVVIGNAQQTEVILLGNKRIIFNTNGTVTWESV